MQETVAAVVAQDASPFHRYGGVAQDGGAVGDAVAGGEAVGDGGDHVAHRGGVPVPDAHAVAGERVLTGL